MRDIGFHKGKLELTGKGKVPVGWCSTWGGGKFKGGDGGGTEPKEVAEVVAQAGSLDWVM